MPLVLALLIGMLCTEARAQELPSLSARGNQIIDGALGGAYSNEREPGGRYNNAPKFRLYVQPSWLYFVRDRVGLGAYLGYQLSRPATGFDARRADDLHNLSAAAVREAASYQPLAHDLSAGVTAALELFRSGRLSLFARPYLGVTVAWRRSKSVVIADDGPVLNPWGIVVSEHRRDAYFHCGVRLPLVYQLTSNLGMGFGPDVQLALPPGYVSVRVGLSTWLARAF